MDIPHLYEHLKGVWCTLNGPAPCTAHLHPADFGVCPLGIRTFGCPFLTRAPRASTSLYLRQELGFGAQPVSIDARFPFTTRSDSGSAPGISQVQRSPKERSTTSLDNYYWCGTRRGVLWFNGVVMAIGRARRFFGRISCIPRHHQHLPLAACGEQRPVLLQLAALPVA